MVAFALNHMTAPRLRWDAFLELAASLGCVGVEFRNDLPGPLFDGAAPEAVAERAAGLGLRVLALAEVKMFNDWSEATRDEAAALMRIARGCGAEAVSLIPRNDGKGTADGARQAALVAALRALRPMLEDHGLIGLVEPLGFGISSLRHKAEAVAAIAEAGGAGRFRLVHDTFHHHLAGEAAIRAADTGIVHVSGVVAADVTVEALRDGHRVLVDGRDRLGSVAQLRALAAAGFDGPVSFEPFAAEVHALDRPRPALAASMEFIRGALARQPA